MRFGRLDSEKFRDKETGKIPEHCDSSKMEKLEDDQVGWFDECHKKCHIGHKITEGKNDEFLVFPRDENGKLDLENGTHSSEKKHRMKVKCDQEARFCFGAAMVTKSDNNPSNEKCGVRCEPFDHSGKLLLSIKDYKARQKAEMRRVNSLSDKKGKWVVDPRPPDTTCQNDELTVPKGCGKKTVAKLKDHGIEVVGDLKKEIPTQTPVALCSKNVQIAKLREQAQNCRNEDKPIIKDHRRKDNPHEAKCG